MYLSHTERQAINAICSLTVLLLWISVLRGFILPITAQMTAFQLSNLIGYLIAFLVTFVGIVYVFKDYMYYFSDLYSATMEDSIAVLKVSLLLGLILSAIAAIHPNLTIIFLTLSFLISPILYDFVRDSFFPETRFIPWENRKVPTRLLEILIEAIISALIGFALRLALQAVM